MIINESGYNKIQINSTINKSADGTVISKNTMLNVREESVDKAYALYSALERKINGETDKPKEKTQNGNILRTPMCPKCNEPMILRTSKKGEKFWGCSTFPSCSGTMKYQDGARILSEEVIEVVEV